MLQTLRIWVRSTGGSTECNGWGAFRYKICIFDSKMLIERKVRPQRNVGM